MTTNILFIKFEPTEDEDDYAFERRIALYKKNIGDHNKNMHHENVYFDSGFDLFQPKTDIELENKTYKVDLGIRTAMYNVQNEVIRECFIRNGHVVGQNMYFPPEKVENFTNEQWQEVISFRYDIVNNFTNFCVSNVAKAEPYVIHPRSSIYKQTFRLANSTGIIDTGYRGNLGVAIDNISVIGSQSKLVEGDRYFQICRADLQRFYVSVVLELPKTKRGSGGFGSTGR